jgi:excisionase family DNA binding protein
MSIIETPTQIFISEEVQSLAKSAAESLRASKEFHLTTDGSPSIAAKHFVEMLNSMGQGQPITILPLQAELTLQEAAEILYVSESFLTTLLDSGKLAYRKNDEQYRILLKDLLEYKREREYLRQKSLAEMVRLNQEMGFYD